MSKSDIYVKFEFSPVTELTDEQIKDIDYAHEKTQEAYNSIMEAMQEAKNVGKMEIYRTLAIGADMVDAAEREYHRKVRDDDDN
jgi:phosphoribosylaminoimidazole (AIR) synthetase